MGTQNTCCINITEKDILLELIGHNSTSANYKKSSLLKMFFFLSFQKLIPAVEFLDLGHNFLSLVENLQVSI